MFNASNASALSEMEFYNNCPAHRACRDGDAALLSRILESNPNLALQEDPYQGLTPIHWAALFGHLDCVRQVASVKHNAINIQSSRYFVTPIHCASEASHPHCVLWLLQAGANPEVKDFSGETALHKASRKGNAECVSLLIAASCNVSVQNSNGQTASALAEVSGYTAIAEYIRKSELASLNDFQRKSIAEPNFSVPRFNRKRTHDVMSQRTFKRMRSDGISTRITSTSTALANNVMNPMQTSVIEHEKLCRMECGYTNSVLEMFFSEFHGC